MKSLYEQMGGNYHEGTDGLLCLNLLLLKEDAATYGMYGNMRRKYLKEHHEGLFTGLLLFGKLTAHLNEIDDTANARMELLTKKMAQAQGITEELKARDQTAWVGEMENVRNAAEEIFTQQLLYK